MIRWNPCLAAFLLVFAAVACGDSDDGDRNEEAGPVPAQATVTFVYVAATALDPEGAERFPGCVAGAERALPALCPIALALCQH